MNRCKSIFILTIFFSLFTLADAIPRMISYQGVLTDASGSNVANGSYNLTFHLYDTPTGGTPIWSEGKPVIVANGVFETRLGDISTLDLNFDKQIGRISANSDDLSTTMPYNQYQTSMNELYWDMKDETITFKNEGKEYGDFLSIHPDQDSLTFQGKTAIYDLKTNE